MILRFESYRAVPWGNGRGITHDIVVDGGDPPQRRLSLATIDRNGPFSDLRGYDRTIVLAAGHGFTLDFDDGTSVTLDRIGALHAFAGEAMPRCTLLDGTVKAFNVLVRRESDRAAVRVVRLSHGAAWSPSPANAYVFVAAGELHGAPGRLHAHDTWACRSDGAAFQASEATIIVEVALHGQQDARSS